METRPEVVAGDADGERATAFRNRWHGRIQRILDAPADGGPFATEDVA